MTVRLLILLAASLLVQVIGAGVEVIPFGRLSDGRETRLWRVTNGHGLVFDFTDYGCRIVRALVPDREGRMTDVTLGWNTAADYERYRACMGTVIGRFANRIADGRFVLDGKVYDLEVNERKNERHSNLHSAPDGWDRFVWQGEALPDGVVFTRTSPDGESGFPGTVRAKIVYRLLENDTWRIDYEAVTDRPTIINLTNHAYWNLAGESSGDTRSHELKIFADRYAKTDARLIPIRDVPVESTPYDFRKAVVVGERPDLDHNFVLSGRLGELHPAATLHDPRSGRTLDIWTTEPCLQVYTGQGLGPWVPSKTFGRTLCKWAGIALETQHYPDSPNHPEFPSVILRPGEIFRSATEYRFALYTSPSSPEITD